ncbi:MAG: YihY family inner membrane protein [Sulfuricella sp.]|nr:YihY family inner membrane protein [Sulfuricella sp.]
MPNNLPQAISFLRFLRLRFDQDRCIQFATSLTYTTLLALVPVITIALIVLSAFPVFAALMTQFKLFILSNFVPASAGKIITGYMQQFSEQAAHLTAIGVAFLGVTAIMLMLTIDHAFNEIWRVRRQRSLLHRFLIYWAALTLGPLMIGASLSLTSYLVSLSLGLVQGVPLVSVITLRMMPMALTIVAFALLYLIVPNRPVSPRHAMIGGVVAGLAFELMKKLFTVYITHFSTYTLVYGAFASIPIFLIWIYLSWLVVLSGAVIAAALPYWDRHDDRPRAEAAGRDFFAALALLQALYRAQQTGEAVGVPRLQLESNLGWDETEDILDRLHALKWAGSMGREGWVLTRGADQIRLADIYREFVFEPEHAPAPPVAARLLVRLTASLDEVLGLSLEEFSRG